MSARRLRTTGICVVALIAGVLAASALGTTGRVRASATSRATSTENCPPGEAGPANQIFTGTNSTCEPICNGPAWNPGLGNPCLAPGNGTGGCPAQYDPEPGPPGYTQCVIDCSSPMAGNQSCTTKPPPCDTSISGRVTDQEGRGVPGVRISGLSTKTDARGFYSARVCNRRGRLRIFPIGEKVLAVTACHKGKVQGNACVINNIKHGGVASFRVSRPLMLTGRVTSIGGPDQKPGPMESAVVDVGGRRATTGSDGKYSLVLPRGHYQVRVVVAPGPHITFTNRFGQLGIANTAHHLASGESAVSACRSGAVRGDGCQINLNRGPGVANFRVGEKVSVSFDPATVAGDGFGFAHWRVKLTGASGQPLAGHSLLVGPLNDSNQAEWMQLPDRYRNKGTADQAIVCTPDGRPITPALGSQEDGSLNLGINEATVKTDANGSATGYVFAGKTGPLVATQDQHSAGAGGSDPSLVASDVRQQQIIVATSEEAVLHVTPGPAVWKAPYSFPAPSPHQLASQLAGSADLVNASSAEIQNVLLEQLISLRKRQAIEANFAPVTGEYGIVGATRVSGVGFGTAGDVYSPPTGRFGDPSPPGDVQASDSFFQMLDQQFATSVSLQGSSLPDQLPTYGQWAHDHPFIFGGAGATDPGVIFDGHVSPVVTDAFTYFDFWPYPPADMRLRLLFERCVPQLPPAPGIFAQLFSPLHLEFVDSHGNEFGIDSRGNRQLKIPGGLMLLNQHPAEVMVPNGDYTVKLTGTGSGPATVAFYYPGHGAVQSTRVFTFKVQRGQTGVLRINGSSPAPTLQFGGQRYRAASGFGLQARGLPKRLRKGRKRSSVVRITDQTGRPAIDATVTVVGRRFRATALADQRGRVRLTLNGVPGGLRVTLAGLGYQTTHLRIAVR